MELDKDIASLDLDCISFKVVWDEKWTLDKINEIELEYRWFLQAIRANPGFPIAPEKSVDLYWHHHILDTSKYIEDCTKLFARYIHHFPYTGVFGNQDENIQKARYEKSKKFILTLKHS